MIRRVHVMLILLALLAAALPNQDISAQNSSSQTPHWIWGREDAALDVELTHSFEIESPVVSVRLTMASISARATLLLDDKEIAALEPYDPLIDQRVPSRLAAGTHRLTLSASKVAGPPGVFLCLTLTFADGQQRVIETDRSWKDSMNADTLSTVRDLGAVEEQMLIPADRQVRVGVRDNYEQWKRALGGGQGPDPASFLVTPGFEINLVRQAEPGEDSWVGLEFTPDRQLIIAKEKRGLLRMKLSNDGDAVLRVESFAESLQECRGLAFLKGDLYANANNSKGLYRLPAAADGFLDPVLLYGSSGGVGHGRNDLAVGPDEKLYSIHGDAVDLPLGDEVLDYTSPHREARHGKQTREGHLLRIDPEAAQVELLAAGLRNPYGIDFNRDGEVFTYDADAEFDMGAPWYRPTRVSHLVVGGDYGWRGVTGDWPPYYPDHPDNARSILDIGKGSPTAVKFARGIGLPERFKEALFILDWAYGRIIAVHLVPRGASYMMVAETFLQGRPLNVTDLEFAADGSLYLVTGGRQTQSALYRVRWTGADRTGARPTSQLTARMTAFQSARLLHAKQSRRLRRELESQLLLPAGEESFNIAWEHLGSSDPWISNAARHLLERQPISTVMERLRDVRDGRRATQAMLALARSRQLECRPEILQRLNDWFPKLTNRDDRTAALYTYQLCIEDPDAIPRELRTRTADVLDHAFPSGSTAGFGESQDWRLSELLVQLDHPKAVSKSIALLNRASGQRDQLHYLHVLRRASRGWTIKDRTDYFSALKQARHYLVGAGMAGFLNRIREESVATLTAAESAKLASLLNDSLAGAVTSTKETQPTATHRGFVQHWQPSDFRVQGAPTDFVGDPVRGAAIFVEANCADCHRFGAAGNWIGPDLTSVASRFKRQDLINSILEPSDVIAESYQAVQVVTTSGQSFTGLATMIGDYRSPQLRLATNPADPLTTIDIPKAEIESQKPSSVSWMPAGLVDHFSRQEIEDLLAYLQAKP